MKLPNFRSTPPLVVGTPVFLAKLCLAAVIPSSLFNENENPNFPIFYNLILNKTDKNHQNKIYAQKGNNLNLSSPKKNLTVGGL